MHSEFWWGNILRKALLEDMEIDGRITLTWI
jgi:hypothetical protein